MNRKTPSSAIELVQAAAPYELGISAGTLNYSCIYPAYIRGGAYLAAGQGAAAAAEFPPTSQGRVFEAEIEPFPDCLNCYDAEARKE